MMMMLTTVGGSSSIVKGLDCVAIEGNAMRQRRVIQRRTGREEDRRPTSVWRKKERSNAR